MMPATGIVPKGIPGFQKEAMLYNHNPVAAKDLLKQAGYPDGNGLPPLVLGYDVGVGHDKAAQAIQAQAGEVGITFNVASYEWEALLDRIQAGEITFFRMDWTADYPTMDNFLYPLFHSSSLDNTTHYRNPEVDKLLMGARRELNPGRRVRLYRKAEKIILRDASIVPIGFYTTNRVIGSRVRGYIRTAVDDTPMERVWLSK